MKSGNRAKQIKAYIPNFLKIIIMRCADDRNISESDFIGKLLIENVDKYAELSAIEKRVIDLKKFDINSDMLKYIRSKSAEKLNFIRNIKKQMWHFSSDKQHLNEKEIIRNMKLNYEIAQINGWKQEAKTIKQFLKGIKNRNLDIDLSGVTNMKQLMDKKGEFEMRKKFDEGVEK